MNSPTLPLSQMSMIVAPLLLYSHGALSAPVNSSDYHGFVSPPAGRGTIDIVWSCLLTLVFCIWTSMHLDMPGVDDTKRDIILEKIGSPFATAMAPEVMTAAAMDQFFTAYRQAQRIRQMKHPDHQPIPLSHLITITFCANLNGLTLPIPIPNQPDVTVDGDQLFFLLKNNYMELPPTLYSTIKDKSKSDGAGKAIACLQASWLVVQCLARAIQHLPITSLELTTCAYVFFTIIAHGFWFLKPLRVGTTTTLTLLPSVTFLPTKSEGGESEITALVSDTERCDSEASMSKTMSPSTSLVTLVDEPAKEEPDSRVSPAITIEVFRLRLEASSNEQGEHESHRSTVRQKIQENIAAVFFVFTSMLFGAWHCIAWNFHFPSHTELLIWRTCSVITAAFVPFTTAIMGLLVLVDEYAAKDMEGTANVIGVLILLCYSIARLMLLAELFAGLRSVPSAVFETVEWTRFIPHL